MTNPDELWDLFEKNLDPEEMKRAKMAQGRSNFRPPFSAATVDIIDAQPQRKSRRDGSTFNVLTLRLGNLRDVQLYDGKRLPDDGECDLELPMNDKPSADDESSLTISSIRALKPGLKLTEIRGLKNVRLVEQVHTYTGRAFIQDDVNGSQVDRDGNLGYWGNEKKERPYYRAVSIGGSANGATAPAAKLSDELRMAALAVLEGKSSPDEFSAVVMKDEAVLAFPAADRAVLGVQVMNGSFIKQAVADGLATVNDGVYELRVPA